MPQTKIIKKQVAALKALVKAGELASAFAQLFTILEDYTGGERLEDIKDAVTVRSASYEHLKREKDAGTLTEEQYRVELAKITIAISNILDEIPDAVEPPELPVQIPPHEQLERIIGINNLLNISWLEQGLRVARSICRIIFKDGTPQGTGFLVAPNLLMTNNHVISSEKEATTMLAEFNYQLDLRGQPLPISRYELDPHVFLTSPLAKFDYTLIGLVPPTGDARPLTDWGTLKLNPNADPLVGEHVVIIQHPGGAPKQIALTANQVVEAWEHRLFYTTDTQPGSSGSPVFNQSWEVIALHHAGGDMKTNEQGDKRFVNEGVLMSWIKKDAAGRWPGT